MNARRKKTGARVVPARKAAPARQPAARASAAKSAKSAKKPAGKSAPKSSKAVARGAAKSAASASKKSLATVLGADCTIEHAPALHQQLAKVLGEQACVTLDFSAVKRCDTAGLQVLAAFIRERREAGLAVELTGTSDNFLATANVLGLAVLFGADDAAQTGVA